MKKDICGGPMPKGSRYRNAMERPCKSGGGGWAHADKESMQASQAQTLGVRHCMQPKSIFDWAVKHKVDLLAARKLLHPYNDILLVAVLNNWSIEKTQAEIAKAAKETT